jgi:site-specific recombinase XerD
MRLSDRGEELVTVAEILGHTDIRMTKRYSHGMQERKREALEKLVSSSGVSQKRPYMFTSKPANEK